jgi:dTMP kinase
MKGKLIVIEGFDGVGKSTQIDLLYNKLISNYGKDKILRTKFPNYIAKSSYLVREYLNGGFYNNVVHFTSLNTAKGVSMIYAIDRHHTFYNDTYEKTPHRLIDLLNKGCHIICDRYTTANILLQGAKLHRMGNLDEYYELIDYIYHSEYDVLNLPKPDAVIILNVPLEISLQLLKNSGKVLDIHETESFQKAAHNAFKDLMKEKKMRYITNEWTVLDCYTKINNTLLPIETIHTLLYNIVERTINGNDT